MKRAKTRRSRQKARDQERRAARGPQGGTAAAYAGALDLTGTERKTKTQARLRRLRQIEGGQRVSGARRIS